MSDSGSDENDCHTESAPCLNQQTVLDRATEGADIYVTSDTLSLDAVHRKIWINFHKYYFKRPDLSYTEEIVEYCTINGSISYSISSVHGTTVNVTCSGYYQ